MRVVGQAPLAATVYVLDRLCCNLRGEVFTAPEPEAVGPEKYDETTSAKIALLKYGSGMPFYVAGQLQLSYGRTVSLYSLYQGSAKFTSICVATSTGSPFSSVGS